MDVDRTKSHNIIASLTSFVISKGGNFFVNEDIEPETSSATHSSDDYNHFNED